MIPSQSRLCGPLLRSIVSQGTCSAACGGWLVAFGCRGGSSCAGVHDLWHGPGAHPSPYQPRGRWQAFGDHPSRPWPCASAVLRGPKERSRAHLGSGTRPWGGRRSVPPGRLSPGRALRWVHGCHALGKWAHPPWRSWAQGCPPPETVYKRAELGRLGGHGCGLDRSSN